MGRKKPKIPSIPNDSLQFLPNITSLHSAIVRKITSIIVPIPKDFNANLNSLANILHIVYTA